MNIDVGIPLQIYTKTRYHCHHLWLLTIVTKRGHKRQIVFGFGKSVLGFICGKRNFSFDCYFDSWLYVKLWCQEKKGVLGFLCVHSCQLWGTEVINGCVYVLFKVKRFLSRIIILFIWIPWYLAYIHLEILTVKKEIFNLAPKVFEDLFIQYTRKMLNYARLQTS